MKGEFQKRAYTKDDIESLIQSRWNETFVNMKDVDEARKEFPTPFRNHWKEGKLITWQDEVIKWFEKWFSDENKEV